MNIKKFIKNPYKIFNVLATKQCFHWLKDETYVKLAYRASIGKKLSLNNPQTFNEKLQWLKLYDRKSEYTMMADKYLVRKYIAEKLGEEYLIPLLGAWDSPEEIDFDALPNQFVLKCNHNSGLGMCICKDKSKLDIEKVKHELEKGLAQDYYLTGREWIYKDIPRKIICEQFMEDETTAELRDYKFMCFDGIVKCSFVCSERFNDEGLHVTFFDRNWKVMPFERRYPHKEEGVVKPVHYEKMVELAETLSKNLPFVRVDFYEVNGKIYFGELTFFPGSGFEEFTPETWDYTLGSWIDLRAPLKTLSTNSFLL